MIAADLPAKRVLGRSASPWKVYPAWETAFGSRPVLGGDGRLTEVSVPICTECGREAPRDGCHRCLACRGER